MALKPSWKPNRQVQTLFSRPLDGGQKHGRAPWSARLPSRRPPNPAAGGEGPLHFSAWMVARRRRRDRLWGRPASRPSGVGTRRRRPSHDLTTTFADRSPGSQRRKGRSGEGRKAQHGRLDDTQWRRFKGGGPPRVTLVVDCLTTQRVCVVFLGKSEHIKPRSPQTPLGGPPYRAPWASGCSTRYGLVSALVVGGKRLPQDARFV